jgi:hypothetical protein
VGERDGSGDGVGAVRTRFRHAVSVMGVEARCRLFREHGAICGVTCPFVENELTYTYKDFFNVHLSFQEGKVYFFPLSCVSCNFTNCNVVWGVRGCDRVGVSVRKRIEKEIRTHPEPCLRSSSSGMSSRG